MADRVSANIRVGGVLPADALAEFMRIIEEEDLGPGWDESFVDADELTAYICDGASGVSFYAHEVRRGEFDGLQAFCVRQGLTYVLTYDGFGGEWGPGRRIRRPEDGDVGVSCPLDADGGSACITAEQIKALGLTSVDAILSHLERFDLGETPALIVEVAAPAGDRA